MFAILAAIAFGVGFTMSATAATGLHPWMTPVSMICLGGFFLALHLIGPAPWSRDR